MRLLRDRQLAAGLLLIIVGSAVGLHAWNSYPIGTFRRIGPGMFPLGLALTLLGLGIATAISAMLRPNPDFPKPAWRPFAAVMGAVFAFAIVVKHFGMIPAIVVLTVIAACADQRLSFSRISVLAITLSAIAFLIFRVALSMPLEPFRWPF